MSTVVQKPLGKRRTFGYFPFFSWICWFILTQQSKKLISTSNKKYSRRDPRAGQSKSQSGTFTGKKKVSPVAVHCTAQSSESDFIHSLKKVCCSKSWSNCINITELVPKWSRVLSHPIALLVLFQSGTEGENLNMTGVQQTQT